MTMSYRVIIIDDSFEHIIHIRELLHHARVKDSIGEIKVWPEGDRKRVFTDWDKAWEAILQLRNTGYDPRQLPCILLLDVALGRESKDIQEGIEAIKKRAKNPLFDRYVTIAVTSHQPAAREGLVGIVDGIIYKNQLLEAGPDSDRPVEDLIFGLQDALRAWTKRTGSHVTPASQGYSFRIVDSAAARRLEASVGRKGIGQLMARVGRGWGGDLAVEALSGGYSGAYLIRAKANDGARQLVIKLARERKVLEEELVRWQELLSYPIFSEFMIPFHDTNIHDIDHDLYYMTIESIVGNTLESEILSDEHDTVLANGQTVPALMAKLFDSLQRIYMNNAERGACEYMTITNEDADRFHDSMGFLLRLSKICHDRGYVSRENIYTDKEVENFFNTVVLAWDENIRKHGFDTFLVAPQHGDLNPRNILLASGGQIRLIDCARSGRWPVGYDIIRLTLQLLLRTLDVHGSVDSFPNNIESWIRIWRTVGGINGSSDLEGGFVTHTGDKAKDLLALSADASHKLTGIQVMTFDDWKRNIAIMQCFDAIKICSYQDASVFKRLLFLVVAIDSAIRAEIFHVSR